MVLAEDLRQAVLQAALQGKLTEQLETDSNVDEMLINIQAEKKKLIAEKKIKKEKPLPEIQEEDIPFDIPDNWRWTKIGKLVEIKNGFTPKRTDESLWNPKEIAWFTVEDIHEQGLIIHQTAQAISKKALGKSVNRLIPPHTVLLCCTSATIGRYAMTEIELTTNQQWNGLVIGEECRYVICSEYILVWVSSLKEKMTEIAKSTTFPFLSVDKLANFIIPLPPIEEQQRIVDKINKIMPKIDEYEKTEKKLEALKKEFPINMKDALLQAAMQGKLTEQLESDSSVDELLLCIEKDRKNKINSGLTKKDKRLSINYIDDEDASYIIPDTWRMVMLGSIVYKLTDGTHKTPKYAIEGVKFVSVKDMSSGKLDLSNTKFITQAEHNELYKRCNPEKGDMLISKVGTTGVPAIIDTDEQFSLFVSVALLKYNHQYINEKFLYYLLMSPLIQEQVKENTRGIGNKNWVLDFIAKTVIVLPPIEEQQRIVERLDALLPLCEALGEV